MIMSSSTARLLIASSTTSESDCLSLQTNRAESSIMILPWQASSPGHDNSALLSAVVPGHGAMDVVSLTADRLLMALNEPCMGACHECCIMCVREHGTSREICHGGSLRPPCFYKMVSEYCVEGGPACWMQLPSAFVRKHMPQVDRKRMVLENADGKPWPVVYIAEHGFFTGWAAFSTANNLAIGDILFFSFVEEAKFAVHVFGKSGCEKRVPTETPLTNPSGRNRTPVPTQTQSVNRASSPAPRSFARGFTRSSRLDSESGGCNTNGRGDWQGFRTPASLSHGGTYAPPDDNTTPHTDHPRTPNWRPLSTFLNSESYKFHSQSAPPPRNHAPLPSRHGEAAPSACPHTKPGQQGDPGGEKEGPRWGKTWSKIHARALVTKAILRKMNITPLLVARQRVMLKSNRNSVKKRSFAESVESDGEIGFDASSGYDGGQRRSSSKDGAFVSSLDDEDEAAAADLRAFSGYGVTPTSIGRSRHHEMANSFDDAPAYAPDYVQQRRKPGRPRKYPPPTMPEQPRRGVPDSSDGGQAIEKRRRGRPFKHRAPGETDSNGKPLREIFVSRRRKVTQAERDEAINSAYRFASRLKSSTTFVVVMRQSFVYRSFVLGVKRQFAKRYMPDSNREVTLVDEAWLAWYCAWNAGYKYISGRGWRNFALMHCIEEDDALLMEILEDSEIALKIKVHIFRVVPIPEGVTGWHSHVCPPNSYMDLNSGVPIEPLLYPPAKIQPRLRTRALYNQGTDKRVKRELVCTDDSVTSDWSSSFS